jgi:hypothetical protein
MSLVEYLTGYGVPLAAAQKLAQSSSKDEFFKNHDELAKQE